MPKRRRGRLCRFENPKYFHKGKDAFRLNHVNRENFAIDTHPLCAPEAVVQGDCWRISVLTPSLLRLEYDPSGRFEDRPTQMVWNRHFPVPDFHVTQRGDTLELFTEHLHLSYDKGPFSPNGLMIQTLGGFGWGGTWRYGKELYDLKGTARTLDEADGEIELDHGINSMYGYSVLDDSRSMVLCEQPENPFGMWVQPRAEGIEDLYFFGYGHDYAGCVRDFYRLCGKTPLLPRWALGNWWSRYHKYTAETYNALMDRFDAEKVPFAVAVLDMDWHLVDIDPKYGTGWTGYTWNRDFFPDPPAFLQGLHDRGLHVTLNVHPADGVRAYEAAYPKMAEAMGVDPKTEAPIPFDVADPKFMDAYFTCLHHPLEDEGVDFWWLDWQQGSYSKVPGLDPLWMLNHFHFLDSRRRGRRPMTFSRYAGPGSHRYPIGFSGDTIVSWESLKFQPYFTVTASNIGYGWWSHDIGGHMMGVRDDELATRWVQFGVFSPINRLHSTLDPFNSKEPWNFSQEACETMEDFLRLRHALVPYLYTMNRLASREGQPLMRPLYWAEPENHDAYEFPNAYYFGTELLCVPVTEKRDPALLMARAATWLPEGEWVDFATGRRYKGGRRVELWRTLEEMPVFAHAGAIVPMQDRATLSNALENPAALEVFVFTGADGAFTLWEDAGDTPEDRDENWASTALRLTDGERFVIEPAAGNVSVLPKTRSWRVHFCAAEPAAVEVTVAGAAVEPRTVYDEERHCLTVAVSDVPAGAQVVFAFPQGLPKAQNDVAGEVRTILNRAQMSYPAKSKIQQMVETQPETALSSMRTLDGVPAAVYGAVCEILEAE